VCVCVCVCVCACVCVPEARYCDGADKSATAAAPRSTPRLHSEALLLYFFTSVLLV
jgi:hypothetical protein